MSMDVIEITGERREMVDRLLDQTDELMGDGGRCYFQDCFGYAFAVAELSVSGDKRSIEDEVVICENHLQVLQFVIAAVRDDEAVAGFLMLQLDARRTPLGRDLEWEAP